MTTIAYKDGVLASDSLATWATSRSGLVTKIAKRGNVLAAGAGKMTAVQAFLDWFNGGMKGDGPNMGTGDTCAYGFIITPDDWILTFSSHGWDRERNATLTSGSGGEYAEGALAAGATPEEAVAIAIQFDTKSGGPVRVLRR